LLVAARVARQIRALRVVEVVPRLTRGFDVENDRRHARMLFCLPPSMKRFCRGLLVSAALAVLSCARREAAAAQPSILQRHLTGDPVSLDPTMTSEEPGLVVEELMFRPLVGMDATRKPVAGLATSWSVSPDGLVYEFHLDPSATWDDGKSVTSDDV